MSLRLELGSPDSPEFVQLLELAFERADHETALVRRLASEYPEYDPGLCLVATAEDGEPLGFSLFLPRTLSLRGTDVRLAVSSPFAILPQARREGVGRFLLEAGTQALLDRNIRGAVVIGGRPFFKSFGYGSAFNLYSVRARREDLPAERVEGWRGLCGDDLEPMARLHRAAYRGSDGAERRAPSAIDWEAAIPNSHCLAFERDGKLLAYLRFRIRGSIELRECGVDSAAGVQAVLQFLGQLMDEHNRPEMDAHLPPTHPVARALFHSGCLEQVSNFEGAALLRVLDWPGLLSDTAPVWEQPLRNTPGQRLGLGIDGQTVELSLEGGCLSVAHTQRDDQRLHVPAGWGPGLITGHRNFIDLELCDEVQAQSSLDKDGWELVRELFPPGSPMWSYGPLFELADG